MTDSAGRACGRSSQLLRGGSAVAVLALTAMFASACGGSASSTPASSAGSSRYEKALAYSECMRSHGIANFPDPNSSGGIVISNVNNSINQNSPQYISANKSCENLLPNGGQVSAQQQQKMLSNALKFAECMRSHGIVRFPDPSQNGTNGGSFNLSGSGLDPLSQQFQSDMQTCERLTNFTM
jgi:hypothetical protein